MEFTKTESTPITNLQSVASTSKLAVTQKATNTQREPLNLSPHLLFAFGLNSKFKARLCPCESSHN